MLINKVKNTAAKYSMLKNGDRVVVAVSGGPDSICLLNALHVLSDELNLSLHVAHLDHMFRGSQSAEEAMFVAEQAKKLGLSCTVEKIDVPAFCGRRGLSAQAGAREIRYEFLSRVAADVRATRIATGHTASDQAETFLLRLIRGAGLHGLSGIPARRENVIRPLIMSTREEILDYLRTNDIEYVVDPSNSKPVYTRNRVRNVLLPVLKQFNPRIIETLAAEAELLREENEAAESRLTEITAGILERQGDSVLIKRDEFNSLPLVYRRRLLRKSVERAGRDPARLSSVQIQEALEFMAAAQTGRALRLIHGLRLAREYDLLIVRPDAGSKQYSRDITVPGMTIIPELDIIVETVILDRMKSGTGDNLDSVGQENNFWQASFDYDKISPEIRVRNRLPGDWFCPAGMAGKSKKLQDFFVDSKVPRSRRDSILLVTSGEDILWVTGFRIDERFLPVTGTRRILAIQVRKSSN
jgi:tRNA(Ile)-lysidine synthase